MSVTEILEAVCALSSEERAQVRTLLDTLPTSTEPLMTEDEFAEYLAAKGVIAPLTRTEPDDDDWEPIEVTGKPLSQNNHRGTPINGGLLLRFECAGQTSAPARPAHLGGFHYSVARRSTRSTRRALRALKSWRLSPANSVARI